MNYYALASSGRKAVLELSSEHDDHLLRSWMVCDSGAEQVREFEARVVYQPRNTRKRLDNAIAIESSLHTVCVDRLGRDLIGNLNVKCDFLEVVCEIGSFFACRIGPVLDPLQGGWVETLDGLRRIVSPVFRVGSDLPPLFRLSSVYELAGATICSDSVKRAILKSGLKGLSFWDYTARVQDIS